MNNIFEKIFGSNPVAMLLIDSNSEIKIINEYAERLFGYEKNELIGKSVDLLVPEEYRAKHPELVRDFFDSPLPRKMGRGRNLFGLRKDGREFPIEVGLSPIQTDEGTLVMSTIIDLSQQFYAEQRFKLAVESAPNGMLMIDTNGTIMMVNNQIEALFDYPRTELLGSPIEILVPDEFKEHHPQFIKNFIRSPQTRPMGIGRELYGKKSDGTLFPVEIGLQPLTEKEDEVLVLASIVDVTKRRQAEKEIEEKSEELREFAYRTSHDLKAPLTTIASMSQCAEEDLNDNDIEEAKKNIQKIRLISTNLQDLVKSILFLTKTDMDREDRVSFNFEEFVSEVKLNYGSQLAGSGVCIEQHFLHSSDFIVSPTWLRQILENLIGNAIKFCKKDIEQKKVEVCTYNDTDWFYIQVKDNGLGIPPEKQKDVFSMFKRFHHRVEGHGLGLYIVKKLVSKLGGNISFESSELGTSFFLKFPLKSPGTSLG